MKTYDIYLFDLDGTLTDTAPTWLGIFRDGLADFGITSLSDKTVAAHTHDWQEVLKLGIPKSGLDSFIEVAYQRANERLPKAPFYDGATDMLTALKKAGKRLGIYTGMDRPILEPVIAHRKLHDYFEVIIAGTDVEHRKPHQEGIVIALQKMQAPKGRTAVYLGDKDTDILCAQNAGLDSILFYPPDHKLMYDEKSLLASEPTHVISHWNELTKSLS